MSQAAVRIDDPIAAPQAALSPVRPDDRIFSLDVVRGLAVLGILAVNAMTFAWPYPVSMNPTLQLGGFEGEAVTAWQAMQVFFLDKMRTLFSMLFGVSIFLIAGERSDIARGDLAKRRLGWLALFGLLHGLLFWYGDILLPYAIAGFLILLVRSWSAKRLIVTGTLLYVLLAGLYVLAMSALRYAPPEVIQQVFADTGLSATADDIRRQIAPFHGDAVSVTLHLLMQWAGVVPMMLIFMIPSVASLMMIGMGLFKAGFLAGRSPTWVYGLFIALGAGALYLIHQESAAWIAAGFPLVDALARPMNSLLAPLASLAYASALILLARFGLKTILHPLACVGRMAFTNYLSQTLIMTTLFYGGRGLGWYGEVGWPEMWGVIAAVWVAQLIWSPLWLSRFQMGPLEWVWRRLTYRRAIPLTRARA